MLCRYQYLKWELSCNLTPSARQPAYKSLILAAPSFFANPPPKLSRTISRKALIHKNSTLINIFWQSNPRIEPVSGAITVHTNMTNFKLRYEAKQTINHTTRTRSVGREHRYLHRKLFLNRFVLCFEFSTTLFSGRYLLDTTNLYMILLIKLILKLLVEAFTDEDWRLVPNL